MTEAKNPKQHDLENRTLMSWSFGFRYCLVFSASDLEFDSLNYVQLLKRQHIDSLAAIGYLYPSIRYELRGNSHL